MRPRHAVVQGTAAGRRGDPRRPSPVRTSSINGVRLGTDPTPVLHGDKIQIAGHEILAVDSRRAGSTQLFDSGAFADLLRRVRSEAASPAADRRPAGLPHRRPGVHHRERDPGVRP